MALEGTLSYLDIAHLLKVVESSEKSGVLDIRWQERSARLFFQRGRLIRAESNRCDQGIGTLLVQARRLRREDLTKALAVQAQEGGQRRLGAILCDDFGVDAEEMERFLAMQFERIVYDVFSWPGGTFTFEFHEPEAVLDRFALDPVDFILRVGIRAGLLAEEGVERERGDPEGRLVLALLRDPRLREGCCRAAQGSEIRLVACESTEQLLDRIAAAEAGSRPCAAVVELSEGEDGGEREDPFAVLESVRRLSPDLRLVAVGGASDPGSRVAARVRGADAYVRKPDPRDLLGPQRDTHLEVFRMALGQALRPGRSGTTARQADEGP
ncbi:MAG: hypothetical protein Kow0092_08980 [Deferrisomatales bacterium]